MKASELTVLSFGGGQDSTALLYKLLFDKVFRDNYAPNNLLVVMADTLNEHLETYTHVKECQELCYNNGIDFKLIKPDEGYHTGDWKDGLIGFYEKGNRIGSKAFPKTCTDKLKIQPIYHFLEEWIHKYYKTDAFGRKKAMREFVSKHGKIKVLIGIAKKEEKRAGSNEDSPVAWMRDCIDKQYPLIDMGMDRQDCQDYIQTISHKVPLPSNCILCPFMSMQELVYLYKVSPDWYHKWVKLEANKIKAFSHVENNLGVWGRKLLPQVLEEALTKYGDWSKADLMAYKMSHGHCVKSKY